MVNVEQLDKVLSEISQWNDGTINGEVDTKSLDLLINQYLGFCKILSFTNPETIQKAQRVLGRAVAIYAQRRSPIYQDKIDLSVLKDENCLERLKGTFSVNKMALMDKLKWYTEDFVSTETSTSGTTGSPFKYKIWNDVFVAIEKDLHYGAILDEFGLEGPIAVLNMVNGFRGTTYHTLESGTAKIQICEGDDIANYVARLHCSHGREGASMHHILFGEDAYFYIKDYCNFVVKYCQEKEIDVLLASGGLFELLCTHLITNELSNFPRLCRLLSNTGDRVNKDTLEFLVEAGVAEDWCDHMRCWDGGATFFTCKHHRYHLMDELAYVYSDSEDRLTSIDFFSYPSPFINYTNGDFCQIENDYKQCDCGRWYRPFKFLNRRPRSNRTRHGTYYDSQKIHDQLTKKYNVKFVSYQDNMISIEDSGLTQENKDEIVREMAQEHIAVHFFTQKNLGVFVSMMKGSAPTGPGLTNTDKKE